ncbi:MAG: DUF4032 domain-containing protein [Propionibacteriaceae bacterium]
MPRFISAKPDTRLLGLPWDIPLEEWPSDLLIALPRGISRHIVRFISINGGIYAVKEVVDHLARHEYTMLQALSRSETPAVEAIGVVSERFSATGEPLDSILITRHLSYSLPYRSLFENGVREESIGKLIDALVALMARLHLRGFSWGDVSLSNVLFKRDAEDFAAYLVDAETGELHTRLSDGQRVQDIEVARVNIFGELMDLMASGSLPDDFDALALVDAFARRYYRLWTELTVRETIPGHEASRIERRVRRLNALGFDVAELDISTSPAGDEITFQPKVVETGYHQRRLMRLTGMDVEEHQARRLLNDFDAWRAHRDLGYLHEGAAATQWLHEQFEPVMRAVPHDLWGKRDAAQLYHEVLDYRWYKAEREQRDIPIEEAAAGYVHDVLAMLPEERVSDASLALMHND